MNNISLADMMEQDTDPDAYISPWQIRQMNKKSDVITLQIPRKGLATSLAPSSARMKLSTNQTFVLASEVIKAGKGKIKDFSMSRSTFYRPQKLAEETLSKKLIDKFKQNSQNHFMIIHWDGKKVKLRDTSIREHLAILMQPVDATKEIQFIGAPGIQDGTGLSMKEQLVGHLQAFDIYDNLVGMCFDTTASNTGPHNGAAALLENELGKSLLWIACRHHVAELHVGWADYAIRHPTGNKIFFLLCMLCMLEVAFSYCNRNHLQS